MAERTKLAKRKTVARELPVISCEPPCSSCGKPGAYPTDGFDPPQWAIENNWLLEYAPLCCDCLARGERIALCFEGGSPHNYYTLPGASYPVCLDCGESEENPDETNIPTHEQMTLLEAARRKTTIELRRLEIRMLESTLSFLSGSPRQATTARIDRLRRDLEWLESYDGDFHDDFERAATEALVKQFEDEGVI